MNLYWFWSILFVLQSVCLWVGYRAAKRQKSQADYFLAGKSMTFFPLLMTFVATQVGGGLILGSAEEAFRVGWKILFYPLGAISGFFLLSSTLGKRLASFPVSTVAQIFELVYGSKRLKQAASALSILTLFMITVAQVIASQKFLGSFMMAQPVYFLIFWVVVILYTMWGGMEGIAAIDTVQATYFLVVFALSAVSVFWFQDQLSFSNWTTSGSASLDSSSWIGWYLMPCLFMLIEQDMAQRCFSARSPSIMKKASLGSAGIIFFVSLIPIFFGLLGRMLNLTIPQGSSVLMGVVTQVTSPVVTAGVACAVLMAIISTAVSLIHSVSSNLTQDFEIPLQTESSRLIFSKASTLVIGVLAIGVSYFFENIVNVLIQSYELSVVCLFVPILVALFKPQGNARSAGLAIAMGAISFFIFRVTTPPIPRELIELLASVGGFALGELLSVLEKRNLSPQKDLSLADGT
jgi:SSS family solute:Na+ symporter